MSTPSEPKQTYAEFDNFGAAARYAAAAAGYDRGHEDAQIEARAEVERLRKALDWHGVGMVDKQGVSCLCDAEFSFGSGGWVAFNAHLRALAEPSVGSSSR